MYFREPSRPSPGPHCMEGPRKRAIVYDLDLVDPPAIEHTLRCFGIDRIRGHFVEAADCFCIQSSNVVAPIPEDRMRGRMVSQKFARRKTNPQSVGVDQEAIVPFLRFNNEPGVIDL